MWHLPKDAWIDLFEIYCFFDVTGCLLCPSYVGTIFSPHCLIFTGNLYSHPLFPNPCPLLELPSTDNHSTSMHGLFSTILACTQSNFQNRSRVNDDLIAWNHDILATPQRKSILYWFTSEEIIQYRSRVLQLELTQFMVHCL